MLDAPCKFFTLGIIGVVRAVLRKKSESLPETRRMNMNRVDRIALGSRVWRFSRLNCTLTLSGRSKGARAKVPLMSDLLGLNPRVVVDRQEAQ